MMKRIYCLVAFACLIAGTVYAADDPFCGKWKLNQEKSKFSGEQMKIKDLGGNKYEITFGNVSDTTMADGTDQPVHFGRTVSITPVGANEWKMVVKKDGKVVDSMTHTISSDGKTQEIKGTTMKPDGTTSDFDSHFERISSGSGWGGTWQSTDEKMTSPDEYEISLYESDGLTFYDAAYKDTLSMKFDGKDYEENGPSVAPGSTTSGKRVDAHTLDVTDKVKGEVMDHTKFQVSSDGKTLTITVHETGQPNALVFVYEKV